MGTEMVAFGKSVSNTRGVHTPAVNRRASQGSTRSEPSGERTLSPVTVVSSDDDVTTLVTRTG
jgi:hypothetical protein